MLRVEPSCFITAPCPWGQNLIFWCEDRFGVMFSIFITTFLTSQIKIKCRTFKVFLIFERVKMFKSDKNGKIIEKWYFNTCISGFWHWMQFSLFKMSMSEETRSSNNDKFEESRTHETHLYLKRQMFRKSIWASIQKRKGLGVESWSIRWL